MAVYLSKMAATMVGPRFNNKEHTVAIFIDLERAYGSVWRE